MDHRSLGRDLGIFTTSELVGAGFPLWLPDGGAIIAELEKYILDAERDAGYRHVRTPPVGKRELYERSGHWRHFSEDMFPAMPVGGDELVLRPVLCPHHAQVFGSRLRSYRELPLRMAEFGQQFRMERSGVVGGLTRVRGMTLNDAHVFCSAEQAAEEAAAALRMIDQAYDLLGIIPVRAVLALRGPGKSYAGSDAMWKHAQSILEQALRIHGLEAEPVEGEAAFYGPKIDIEVNGPERDDGEGPDGGGHGYQEGARRQAARAITLSTVQVDMWQPERFGLEYVARSGSRERPVIVHRSVLSSMERMVAYLLEAHAGALPPWLSPVQVQVLPVGEEQAEPAWQLADQAIRLGLRAEVDDRPDSLGARVRTARERRVPFLAVIGEREAAVDAVAVRLRNGQRLQPMSAGRFLHAARGNVLARDKEAVL